MLSNEADIITNNLNWRYQWLQNGFSLKQTSHFSHCIKRDQAVGIRAQIGAG